MDLDDEVCLCFHVSQRKILNFLRVERPQRPGQLADCFGAGTGCGWCRTYLAHLFDTQQSDLAAGRNVNAGPSRADYARGRSGYIKSGGGTPPPGATPPDAED